MFKQTTDKVRRQCYGKKICSKSFSNVTNSSDIEIIKQINTLKTFDMEPHKTIPKKLFLSEEEHNRKEEINLTSQDAIRNIDWYKCGCECILMATFAERFCLLLWLKSWGVRVASCHFSFYGHCLTISRT